VPIQKLAFASEARQSHGASDHHYLHWSGLQAIAALPLATTSLKNAYFWMGAS
jgi:hypothetical protein